MPTARCAGSKPLFPITRTGARWIESARSNPERCSLNGKMRFAQKLITVLTQKQSLEGKAP
jgi:hypothetical protein